MSNNSFIVEQFIRLQQANMQNNPYFDDIANEKIDALFQQILTSQAKKYLFWQTAQHHMVDKIKLREYFHPQFLTNISIGLTEIVLNVNMQYRHLIDNTGWIRAINLKHIKNPLMFVEPQNNSN